MADVKAQGQNGGSVPVLATSALLLVAPSPSRPIPGVRSLSRRSGRSLRADSLTDQYGRRFEAFLTPKWPENQRWCKNYTVRLTHVDQVIYSRPVDNYTVRGTKIRASTVRLSSGSIDCSIMSPHRAVDPVTNHCAPWWGVRIHPANLGRTPANYFARCGRGTEQGEEKLCEELCSPCSWRWLPLWPCSPAQR